MRRIALIAALLVAAVAGFARRAGADDSHTYKIEMYNAFGIVKGSDVRIAGVNAGTVTDLDINAEEARRRHGRALRRARHAGQRRHAAPPSRSR